LSGPRDRGRAEPSGHSSRHNRSLISESLGAPGRERRTKDNPEEDAETEAGPKRTKGFTESDSKKSSPSKNCAMDWIPCRLLQRPCRDVHSGLDYRKRSLISELGKVGLTHNSPKYLQRILA